MPTFGGIEAGGTKFVCAIGSSPDDIQAETSIPTTTPDETLHRVISFFKAHEHMDQLSSVGIGSFGPIDIIQGSPTFGYITDTPKPTWAYTDIVGRVSRSLNVPIGFDTDTNAAALGEATWGSARNVRNFVYLTVGTGIGGGGLIEGRLMHGLLHPEMGHLLVPHDWKEDGYAGSCTFHGDCLEGLASGTALLGRWGQKGEDLPPTHRAWDLEAHYLSLGLVNVICTLSPRRIVLGGGVMQQASLLKRIQLNVRRLLNDYLRVPEVLNNIDQYIVISKLGNRAGVLGAIELATMCNN
jgi:fructokinase